MAISREEIGQIADATANKVMEQIRQQREERELRDYIIGGAMGKGAIPLSGRETRKAPCSCCLIDPEGPNEPENRLCTTSSAIGSLKDREEREWCSEINLVPDGRCERIMRIKEAAKECKEKYPTDTEKFFQCYAPAWSSITGSSSRGLGEPKSTRERAATHFGVSPAEVTEEMIASLPERGTKVTV